MKRTVIKIDEEKCVGCGLCVSACHQEALQIIDGKARLISDTYCDGLGKCMPKCPTGAMTLEEREAKAFGNTTQSKPTSPKVSSGGCPGSRIQSFDSADNMPKTENQALSQRPVSQLRQWPVQIQLVPPNAPYLEGSHLLIAADCTAFAYANIHEDYMKNKVTIIGCPKLDSADYSERLTEIFKHNDIKSVTVLRMSVPCCGGITHAAVTAMKNADVMVPWQVVTVGTDGKIIEA
ncbi:4Fe-4S binding protein [Alkalibacter saccharofermentans]|uniref:4Fe-4S binding domain-containing protein n=1 Tax=Alkalibacter saccharofermentans DSM 14828 TaxID=1120975 RepID=A0A1M4XXA2_9FIRM|nr:4Fe-4S binding protein [Alkalibacter saccharofermentans]SHE98060.1 4Fe-4S binding domain-containing protein [Alkalibacter saccharofermentans DSM 14828]